MQAAQLTLAAAIRDADCAKDEPRHKAVRNLAPALLGEIGKPGPLWRAAEQHASGPQVVAKLQAALAQTKDVPLRSLAAIGLGMIGEPSVVEEVAPWIDLEGDDADASFLRECAVIALSFVGAAAREHGDVESVRRDVYLRQRRALSSERPDVRFQAAIAVAEVGGDEAEAALVRALADEQHPEVRENILDAISRFPDPRPATCEALLAIIEDAEEGFSAIGFAAAMVLAGAGRSEAGPRLEVALRIRHERDRALEALAVLGSRAPASAIEAVHALARGLLTPGITRVRAAYALARLHPDPPERNPGRALLRKLAWHPRAAVREAVTDAENNLRDLDPAGLQSQS
jgi:HEAT repeat protein